MVPLGTASDGLGITSVIIPNTVKIIGEGAFRHNNLTSVEIPDTVTSIGKLVFCRNKLTNSTITFPTTPLTIDCNAFDSNLEELIYPSNVTNVCEN